MVDVDFTALKVSGTPTIVMVDGTGKVDDFWVGKLPEAQAEHVANTIRNPKV